MRILCLTDFTIPTGYRLFWTHVRDNTDEITFLSTRSEDKYKKWGKLLTSYPKYFLLMIRALREIRKGNYDLIVAWESDTGLPLALFKRLLFIRKPQLVVLTFSIRGPMAHFLPLLRFAAKGIDFLTVPTKYEKDYYAQLLKFPLEKIYFCPYGTYDIYRESAEYTHESFVFSGGRSERDYKTLFEAISSENIPFIVNARPFNVKGLTVPENVTLNNILPSNQFADLNLTARFVVIPVEAVKQAAGISSVLYAMAAGKAVIATDVPGLHDYVIEDATGLLVPPGDAQKLRQAIKYLWENPEIADRMGKKAREIYSRYFTFEALSNRIIDITKDIYQISKY